jgi:hypothetical protein
MGVCSISVPAEGIGATLVRSLPHGCASLHRVPDLGCGGAASAIINPESEKSRGRVTCRIVAIRPRLVTTGREKGHERPTPGIPKEFLVHKCALFAFVTPLINGDGDCVQLLLAAHAAVVCPPAPSAAADEVLRVAMAAAQYEGLVDTIERQSGNEGSPQLHEYGDVESHTPYSPRHCSWRAGPKTAASMRVWSHVWMRAGLAALREHGRAGSVRI